MMRYATLALCLLAAPAMAEMYKWTDENGKMHYSDQPPPSDVKKSETIKSSKPLHPAAPVAPAPDPAGGKPGAVPPKTATDQEMEFRKRRLQQAENEAKAQKDAQAAEEKKRSCQRATEQVQAFERGGRITRYGPNGEQIYLNDQEIQAELVTARKAADSWCK
jgi:Domain of unknown function (DUF4124)